MFSNCTEIQWVQVESCISLQILTPSHIFNWHPTIASTTNSYREKIKGWIGGQSYRKKLYQKFRSRSITLNTSSRPKLAVQLYELDWLVKLQISNRGRPQFISLEQENPSLKRRDICVNGAKWEGKFQLRHIVLFFYFIWKGPPTCCITGNNSSQISITIFLTFWPYFYQPYLDYSSKLL